MLEDTPAAKLHPKEHGAYVILLIPIVTAFVTGGITLVGLFVAVAAIASFFAHEPALVVWGHRGRRAQRSTPNAKSRLVILLLIAFVAGCVGMMASGLWVRWALVTCLALAAINFAIAVAGRHRTLAGQSWGIIGLSMPCVPMLLAAGMSFSAVLSVWAAWILGFSATTVAVRSVIAAQRSQPRWLHTFTLAAISMFIVIGAACSAFWTLVTLPMIVLSWYLLIAPPPAKHLKRGGWTLLAGTLLTAILAVGTFSSI